MEIFKFFTLCITLVWIPFCFSYVSSYNQPDFYANYTSNNPPTPPPPSVVHPPQQTYNVPYKSAYNYVPAASTGVLQSIPQKQPSVLYVDAPHYPPAVNPSQSLYGSDQTTTEAPPSGIWKIFSIFSLPSLPNIFSHKPDETTTDSSRPYIYQAPPQDGYLYTPQNSQPSYYNYALVHQQSPVNTPSAANSYQYYQTGRYPLHQIPAPGSKHAVPPQPYSGSYSVPSSYSKPNGNKPQYSQPVPGNYPYYTSRRPSTIIPVPSSTVPSYTATPIATTLGQRPASPSTKPPYHQPHIPAYSIYLVPAKPANYYPHNPQGYEVSHGQYQGYQQNAGYHQPNNPVQEPNHYYNNYPQLGIYYTPGNQYQQPSTVTTPTTTTKVPHECDCDKNTTTTTVTTPPPPPTTAATTTTKTPSDIPIDIRNNDRNDVDGNWIMTTPSPSTTPEEPTTTTPETPTPSTTDGKPQARRLFQNKDGWVPLVSI